MKRLVIVLSMAVFAGCYNDKKDALYPTGVTTCDTSNVSYASTIQPIFTQYCATSGCHDAATKQNGYDFSNYDGAVLSIDPNKLIPVITHASGYSAMPKDMAKLSDCNIAKITAWVNRGALNN